MDQAVYPLNLCPLSLRNLLSVHEQPVCEEQAWALCYQLCSLLLRNFSLDHGQSYRSWKSIRLPGPEGIFLSADGSISLKVEQGKGAEHQFVIETEAQTVDYVGRLMYSCLDWGLGADVERELDETLELLVDQMTKVDIRLGAEHHLQPVCAISEVLQVCEERLYNPSQAAQHYRTVCATLYSHTIELCNYLQIIQQTQESLQILIMESEHNLVPKMTTNWDFTWKHLVDELSRGVVLRPPKDKLNPGVSVKVDMAPFNRLLQDIQLRRYTLRKVKVLENADGERRADPHQALLDVIRSGPKLRPVSERKLKPRVQKLNHEVSLHELLMREIRSTDPVKLLSSSQRRRARKERVTGSLSPSVDNGSSPVTSQTSLYEDKNKGTSFVLNAVHSSDQEGAPCQKLTCKDGSTSHEDSYTGSYVKTLSFSPTLSSTPLNLTEGCRLSRGKRRARSLPCKLEVHQLKSEVSVPTTIADVIKTHHRKEGKSSCEAYGNWRICSCCAKRSLYFTWHNFCSLCSRVVCPQCCIELRLPFKWCINLPISFFKKIVLKKESEESQRHFWSERWSWDPSRVPLVLTSSHVSGSVAPPHALAMRDWHNQDVCVGCQDLLLEACDSPAPPSTSEAPQEI